MDVPLKQTEKEDWECLLDDDIIIPDKKSEEEIYIPVQREEKVPEINKPKVRLSNKNWDNVNNCNFEITGYDIAMLIWSNGMKIRWNKSFKKQCPTWHAIGKKWQGQLNKFIKDLQSNVELRSGKYCLETWGDDIAQIAMKEYNKVKRRHHTHTIQIFKSLLEDRKQLDNII